MQGSIQEWIDGFAKEIKERFNKTVRIAIVEKNHKSLVEIVTQIVSDVTGVPYAVIVSNKRISDRACDARNMVSYFSRLYINAPYQQIGDAMGGRDHTTIMHQISVAKNRIAAKDENTKQHYTEIENKLKEVFKTNNNEQ